MAEITYKAKQRLHRGLHNEVVQAQQEAEVDAVLKMIESEKRGHLARYKYAECGAIVSDTHSDWNEHEVSAETVETSLARTLNLHRGPATQMALNLLVRTAATENEVISNLNGLIAIIDEIEPKDALESLLITQMVATHAAAMDFIGQARKSQLSEYSKQAAKFMSIFSAQFEQLRKYRNKGRQTVVVKHVNVEPGGQAIVGDVSV